MPSSITIEELPTPASLDAPGADDFARVVGIRNANLAHSLGSDLMAADPPEVLVAMRDQTWAHKHRYVARLDGELVGQMLMEWDATVPTNVTWIGGGVLPAYRNRGVGTAVFDHVEALARDSGRTVLQGGAIHADLPGGDRIASPTGFGSVPAGDPGVRFLSKRGYGLEQVYRISVLDLPMAPDVLATQQAIAEAKAGTAYRVHTWVSPTPEEWLDDIAHLSARMATDAPAAGLDIDEEVWDAARVRHQEARAERSGQQHLTAAAEHIPSGRLVAFNGLALPDDRGRPVQQGPTLVLTEHRGHRLGMLVKVANIIQLAGLSPSSPLIITDNAEENRPMLGVNEALGFRAIGYEGAWKKTLS